MSNEQQNKKTEKVIQAQANAGQFKGNFDTEFSAEENVQDSMAKSQQFQAKNQQPIFEPNKPI